MKKIILLPLLLVLISCYEGERSCKDFKTGKFKFEHEVDGVKKTTFFERNDSIEIETYEGKTDSASIRWVSDCEYVLQKIILCAIRYKTVYKSSLNCGKSATPYKLPEECFLCFHVFFINPNIPMR